MKRHDYSDSAFSLYGFESEANCADYIARSESMTFTEADVQDGAGGQINKSIRNNNRVVFEDARLANEIWSKLADQEFNIETGWKAAGLNHRFSFYRYQQFQQFTWHRDQPYRPSNNIQSKVTFILYLNDNFSGGQTSFDDFNVWPETGMAVCFHHKLRHCGSVVTDGTKYVLRSDIMFEHEE